MWYKPKYTPNDMLVDGAKISFVGEIKGELGSQYFEFVVDSLSFIIDEEDLAQVRDDLIDAACSKSVMFINLCSEVEDV